MEGEAPPSRLRMRPHWIAEGMLIIVSVALGFALAQLGEARSDRRLAERALVSLSAEIELNLAVLAPLVPVHDRWVTALANPDTVRQTGSGIDVFFATRPPLPHTTPSAGRPPYAFFG